MGRVPGCTPDDPGCAACAATLAFGVERRWRSCATACAAITVTRPTGAVPPLAFMRNLGVQRIHTMPQSLVQIYVHLVFPTKNRQPFLRDKASRERAHAYLAGICANQD